MSSSDSVPRSGPRPGLGVLLSRLSVGLAYAGGLVVAAIGLMSAASIAGRTVLGRPILGDFELVEMGSAIAGSLFLPYCQVARGHVIVDFFTLRAGPRVVRALDRLGAVMMAATLLLVSWRTLVGCLDIARTGETSMLMGIPIWIGYAAMIPGVATAGLLSLAEALGLRLPEQVADE